MQIANPPTLSTDMSALGNRLRSKATEHGARTFAGATGLTPVLDGDRIIAIEFGDSERVTLTAPLFVDASGLRGVLRKASPPLRRWCPDISGDELCTASDFHFRIADRAGAQEFLERNGAEAGETVSMLGLSGGFSTCGITVSADLTWVGVLVGCLANGSYGTGPSMLAKVRDREPWIGEVIHGGSGLIPLRRPYPRFTAQGLALVGDAACQVFPAHGSGIGLGLIAGRILADTLAGPRSSSHADIGDEQLLWEYQHRFMTEFGGLLASYEVVRRMSTKLGSDGVSALLESGVMNESLTRAGLDQRLSTPDLKDLPKMASRLARRPSLAIKVLPMLARSRAAAFLGGSHPSELDLDALGRWDRRLTRVLGPLPG